KEGCVGIRLISLSVFLFCAVAHAITVEREQDLNAEFKVYCEETARFVVKNRYTVTCSDEFHHYNARAAANHYSSNQTSDLKIANYNLLHPGSNKNSYKDMALVAQIMNEYDVISVQELIPRLGNDMRHNQDLVELIKSNGDES